MKKMEQLSQYKNILVSLINNSLFGHYKNSALGFLWHFITPLMMFAVYYIVFTEIRSVPIDDFLIFLASALFPFNFMVNGIAGGAGAVTSNAGMLKKMYFPREIFVLSYVLSNFIVMLLGYAAVMVIVVLSGYPLDWVSLLLLVPLLLLTMLFTLGYVFFFSAITVYVRDVQYALSSITMVFFFLTPMYFTADSVSGLLGSIIWYNPFTYYVEAYHSIIYFGEIPELKILLMCVILPIVSLAIGLAVFCRLKGGFAERL